MVAFQNMDIVHGLLHNMDIKRWKTEVYVSVVKIYENKVCICEETRESFFGWSPSKYRLSYAEELIKYNAFNDLISIIDIIMIDYYQYIILDELKFNINERVDAIRYLWECNKVNHSVDSVKDICQFGLNHTDDWLWKYDETKPTYKQIYDCETK